jgi:hypothetical protein
MPDRLAVPEVPVVALPVLLLPLPMLALVRMNFGSFMLADDEVDPGLGLPARAANNR